MTKKVNKKPLLKQIQPLYEDVYIKTVNADNSVEPIGIMTFKEAKLQYGDRTINSFEDMPSALVTVIILDGGE